MRRQAGWARGKDEGLNGTLSLRSNEPLVHGGEELNPRRKNNERDSQALRCRGSVFLSGQIVENEEASEIENHRSTRVLGCGHCVKRNAKECSI